MDAVIVAGWVLVALYVCFAMWITHDMGPASENGPIAGFTWAAGVLLALLVAVVHIGTRLTQWLFA